MVWLLILYKIASVIPTSEVRTYIPTLFLILGIKILNIECPSVA